jgi:hypothetical protein
LLPIRRRGQSRSKSRTFLSRGHGFLSSENASKSFFLGLSTGSRTGGAFCLFSSNKIEERRKKKRTLGISSFYFLVSIF